MSRNAILPAALAAILLFSVDATAADGLHAKAGPNRQSLTWSGTATTANCDAEAPVDTLQGNALRLDVESGLYRRQKVHALFEVRAADGKTPLVLKLVRGDRYASAWPGAGEPATALEMMDPPAGDYTVAVCAPGAPEGAGVAYDGTLNLLPKAAPVPPPSADPQGLEFSASLVNDLQRDEGEPIIEIDRDGIVYTCGPTGSSQGQDYAQASLDGGDQFNTLGAYPRGQFSAGGGGDCALATAPVRNDQGYYPLAYSGLSNLVTFTTATSPDRGASFMVSPTSGAPPAVDRQWLAFTDGDTVFHNYNKVSPRAITVQRSDDGGLTYGQETAVSPAPDFPGQIRALPPELNPANNGKPAVYYPWSQGTSLRLAVSLDEGASWNNCTILKGRGSVSNQFPVADHDRAGNIYVVYTEDTQFQTYVTAFPAAELLNCKGGTGGDFGKSPIKALPPVQANRDRVLSTVFPWIAAGGEPGRVAVTFYGSEVAGRPDDASLPHVWHVYVSQSLNFLDPGATFAQVRATTRPMHYDQICLQGLGCTTGGDRSLVDFYAMDLNPKNGELVVVYNWAHKRPGDSGGLTSTPVVTRQIAGPSNLGGLVEPNGRTVLRTATEDPIGDAYTDFSRLFVAGQRGSTKALDVTAVEVGPAVDLDSGQPLAEGGFTVTMQILDLGQIALEDGLLEVPAQSLLWVFYYVDGYRHHAAVASWTEAGFVFGHNGYVGAAHECGTPSTGADAPNGQAAGSPDQCMYYPADTPIQGKADMDAGTIRMTVPLSLLKALREVPAPARSPAEMAAQPGDLIHSAAVYTFGNPASPVQAVQSWLVAADNTAAMDFPIPGAAAPAQAAPQVAQKEGRGLFLGALPLPPLVVLALGAWLRRRRS